MKGEHKAILHRRRGDYPFPIPLERVKSGMWCSTLSKAATRSYRRIGRNELDAIQTCPLTSMRQTTMGNGSNGEALAFMPSVHQRARQEGWSLLACGPG